MIKRGLTMVSNRWWLVNRVALQCCWMMANLQWSIVLIMVDSDKNPVGRWWRDDHRVAKALRPRGPKWRNIGLFGHGVLLLPCVWIRPQIDNLMMGYDGIWVGTFWVYCLKTTCFFHFWEFKLLKVSKCPPLKCLDHSCILWLWFFQKSRDGALQDDYLEWIPTIPPW